MSDKIRVGFYLERELLADCDNYLSLANARSRNEFVGQALRFYIGYLFSQKSEDYLLKSLTKVIRASIRDTENRLARMDFKTACSINKLAHILAYTSDAIDGETMHRLNIRSMEEVKHLNGAIRYEDAVKIQRGESAGDN